MSKIKQYKIPVDIQEYDWKLVRERDGLTKYGSNIAWIEWKENGIFGSVQSKPKIGLSCM